MVDIARPSGLCSVFPRNLGQGISLANSLGPRDPKRISRVRNDCQPLPCPLTVTEKKLTDSRKRAQILADNGECHHPSETLKQSQRMVGESI